RLFFQSMVPGQAMIPGQCWLDTGAPLSVIPYRVHHNRLAWGPAGARASWLGQPCDLGHINVWLPTDQPPYLRGPVSMLAKFAPSDPPGDPVPVLLGLEFISAQQAAASLLTPPQPSTITMPP